MKYFYALGRRKTSSATIRLFAGAGVSTINEKELTVIYPLAYQKEQMFKPLVAAGLNPAEYHFTAKTTGGGIKGQLEAIRLGLARAIVVMDPTLKKPLKQGNLLTRDPRMVERKKPGLRKARRAEQYSKR